MSVLIEAVTLVVRRRRFDSAFPGGATTFLAAVSATHPAPRYACDEDPYLLALSFEHADHSAHAISLLRGAGLKSVDDTLPDLADFVLVDATSGPATRIAWLGFNTHQDGFSFAWEVPEPTGALVGPPEWNRQRRDEGDRQVLGDESDQQMLLASENGIRTYLDLRTGALTQSQASAAIPPARPGGPNADGRFGIDSNAPSEDPLLRGRLHQQLAAALSELGWNNISSSPEYFIVQCQGRSMFYSCYLYASEDLNIISCSVFSPLEINVKHRRRVLEFVSRLNCRATVGGFDLNLDSGLLTFRTSVAVGGGELEPAMVASIASHGVAVMNCYLPVAMEIVAGSKTVVEAASMRPES